MASVRVRQRSDGSTYTAVLYVLNGNQTSSSFNDHAEALRFQELANRTSPVKALEVWVPVHTTRSTESSRTERGLEIDELLESRKVSRGLLRIR